MTSKSGVYAIRNLRTGRVYIGSSINLTSRWEGHRNSLQRGDHHNAHLQESWNLDGADAFVFEVIESCLPIEMADRERYWIDAYMAAESGSFNYYPHTRRAVPLEPRPREKYKQIQIPAGVFEAIQAIGARYGSSTQNTIRRLVKREADELGIDVNVLNGR